MELLHRHSGLPFVLDRLHETQRAVADPRSRRRPKPGRPHRTHKLERRLSPEQVASLLTQYQAGQCARELAGAAGVSKPAVLGLLERHGVERPYRALTPEQVDQAIQLYGAGLSAAQVGAVLGCHGSTVWRTLRRAGVELRDEQGRTRGSNSID